MVAGGKKKKKKKEKRKKGTHAQKKMGLGGDPLQIDIDSIFNYRPYPKELLAAESKENIYIMNMWIFGVR